MLAAVGFENLEISIDATVPRDIRLTNPLDLPAGKSEQEALAELRQIAQQNKVVRLFIGAGYSDSVVPPVIQRNILENPGWYTAYTPYQAEIAQGRLEALLNFQTMITDLTALDIANASLLDEGDRRGGGDDALSCGRRRARHIFRLENVPSANDRGRANARSAVGHPGHSRQPRNLCVHRQGFRRSLQYPTTEGAIIDYEPFIKSAHDAGSACHRRG